LALKVEAGEVVTVQLPPAPQRAEAAAAKESGALERKRGAG
jgi:hypothetical protein